MKTISIIELAADFKSGNLKELEDFFLNEIPEVVFHICGDWSVKKGKFFTIFNSHVDGSDYTTALDFAENNISLEDAILLAQKEMAQHKNFNSSTNVVNVDVYGYEKVKKSDVVINIPQEPVYFQEYNHRTIIGLFPQFATWNDNSVWEIQIVKITDNTIEKAMVRTNAKELSDIIIRSDIKPKSQEDYLREKVVRYLKDFFTDDRVSKEVFNAKYNEFLRKISVVAEL